MDKFVVIHTTPATIPIIDTIIQEKIGVCKIYNLMDDSILPEMNEEGKITPNVRSRLYDLVNLAQKQKPNAILSACSSIGGLIEEAVEFSTYPLLRIDEPMAKKAVNCGKRIVVLATLDSTLEPTKELLLKKAAEAGVKIELETFVIDKEKIAMTVKAVYGNADVIVLAQASMATALEHLPDIFKEKVLTSPESGVEQLLDYKKEME